MCYCFRMECRRWAPTCEGWVSRFCFLVEGCWIDGLGIRPAGIVGMRVSLMHSSRDAQRLKVAGLWSTQRENKPNKPSARSATKTLWADLFTFERYVRSLKSIQIKMFLCLACTRHLLTSSFTSGPRVRTSIHGPTITWRI